MSELKPCPFCGGEAELTGFDAPEYWVWCPNCKASTDAHTCKGGAIEAWNTRAETATLYEYGFYLNGKKFVLERTCKQEERGWGTEGDHARVWLTCGHDCMVPTVQDLPNYCPNCGAKVVSE